MADTQDNPDPPPSMPFGPEGESLRAEFADPPAPSTETLMAQAASRISALEEEAAGLKDRWLRSEADAQNARTRAKKDVEDARQFAVQRFARDVVEVAETLERALASLPPAEAGEADIIAKLREGIGATGRMFVSTLERHGVARIEAAGEKFDADRHQAMAEAPSDQPAGMVMQAYTPGWSLNGRLLKPAMVVVSKGPAAPAAGANDDAA